MSSYYVPGMVLSFLYFLLIVTRSLRISPESRWGWGGQGR